MRIHPPNLWVILIPLTLLATISRADEPPSPAEGLRVIRKVAFYPPDFDQETLDNIWTVWPEEMRAKAEKASPAERRQMIFELYGLTPDEPFGKELAEPLGMVKTASGWPLNCLSCHGGEVNGQIIPGLPNNAFDMQSFYEDLSATKAKLGKLRSSMDFAVQRNVLLSTGPGLTAAVNFGIVLAALRDENLDLDLTRPVPTVARFGMEPPPFWNVKYKQRIYCDDFAPKYHRMLMQFVLHTSNPGSYVRRQEKKFRHIAAWIESVEPPAYPFEINRDLAERGRIAFNKTCAECHGTYDGNRVNYPEKVIAIDEIGTDPVRWKSLTPKMRNDANLSWISDYGKHESIAEPAGYLAPPLKGVWASAPYFHNGSVPTLWHVLHPEKRPPIWKRTSKDVDPNRVGLTIREFDALPPDFSSWTKYDRRRTYQTDALGKSNAGHDYPSALTEQERRAVLEYLKTL